MKREESTDLENHTETDSVVVPPTESAKKPRAKKERVVKKAAKKNKATKATARKTVKKAKSPQAQSGEAIKDLSFDKLSKTEQKLVRAVYTPKGEREARSIKELMKAIGAKNSLPVRNGLRRPVRGRWLEKADRGKYRITEAGRKRGIPAGV